MTRTAGTTKNFKNLYNEHKKTTTDFHAISARTFLFVSSGIPILRTHFKFTCLMFAIANSKELLALILKYQGFYPCPLNET